MKKILIFICSLTLSVSLFAQWEQIRKKENFKDSLSAAKDVNFVSSVRFQSTIKIGAITITPTGTELNFVDGVTSAIQTQIDALLDSIATLRALIQVSEVPHVSQIHYVSTSGNDGNDGATTGTPWLTLAYAEAHATAAGDTIALKKGDTWALTTSVAISHSGADGYPITWDGTLWGSGAPAKIQASANRANGQQAIVHISGGASHIIFQNITCDANNKITYGLVIGSWTGTFSALVQNNEHDITIDSCTILNVGNGTDYNIGFLCEPFYTNITDITIQNCTLNGADDEQLSFYCGKTGDGATLSECSNVLIKNNTLTNWGRRGETTGYGLQINNKVTNAIIEENILTTGANGHGNGMQIESNETTLGYFPTGIIVRYNKITVSESDNFCLYIQHGQAKTADIYYNIFVQGINVTDTDGGGVWLVLSASPAWTGAVINLWNNTIYTTSGRSVQNDCAVTGVLRARNNAIYNTGTNDYAQYCLINNTLNATTHSNNGYYRSANVDYTKVLNGGNYYQTNAQVLAWEATAIPTDPKFVTPGTNFHLQVTSPLINKGVDVGLTRDYEGNAISGPDIGAYEYH